MMKVASRSSVGDAVARQQGPGRDDEQPLLLAAHKDGAGDVSSKHKHSLRHYIPAIVYGLMNLSSVVTIVLANKVVMTTYHFRFPVCLTWFHSIVTALGMAAMAGASLFKVKRLPLAKSAPLAAAYVGFVVFNNLSIQVNTVGFYQISKILITPVVVAVEYVLYRKTVSRQKAAAIALLMVGIAVATLSDAQVASNPVGILVAAVAVLSSALYQVWAGSKQKEFGLNGNQLLHQVSPSAVALLAVLIPLLEPVGLRRPGPDTILGYQLTRGAAAWIVFSSMLGLVVTLSTYLFIGATSPLTYNVVGHLKTVFIVTSGVVFFGDDIAPKKLLGIAAAMAGIVWYTSTGVVPPPAPAQQARDGAPSPGGGSGGGHPPGEAKVPLSGA